MKSQENIDLEVTQDGLRFAGIYSLKITEKNARKRVFASLVILNSLADFFMKQNLDVSSTKSLYKATKLSEEFEITDLYVNNWRIDIRLEMPGDCFYIPKSHYENEILPDFYVVATIDKELKTPKFIGYVSPDNLHTVPFNSLYYKANFDDLGEMSDLLQKLKQTKNPHFKEKDHRFFHTKILSYFDNEADNFTKSKLLNHLLGCQNCRTELINFCGFDIIAQELQNNKDLFDDESLNIIGALKAQDDEDEEETEESVSESETQDKTAQGELIDGLFENTPKIKKPITDSRPFKEISEDKIEVLPSNERISLEDTDDIVIQDIPNLEDTTEQNKKEIKLDRTEEVKEEEPILTFTADDTENPKKAQVSVAESLFDVIDIPDEMFNTEYIENEAANTHKFRKNNNSEGLNKERVIVDYDEFGQPIYGESSPEDYKIVEDQGDSFKKDKNEKPAITDTFNKAEENIIEGSSELYNEEPVTEVPYKSKGKKTHISPLMLVVIGIFILFMVFYLLYLNPIFKHKDTDSDIPVLNSQIEDDKDLDDIIAKNINSNTGFIKVKKINWIANKSLLADDDFKEYLKKIDKRFKAKFKLNSNSFTQVPLNNNIVVEFIVTPDGEIKKNRFAAESKNEALDKIIMESLEDAINNVPIPTLTQDDQKLEEYYIKVMIKL